MTDHADDPKTESEGTSAATAPEAAQPAANVNLTALVTEVVKFLVDSPDEVSVEEVNEGRNLVLELMVAQKDVGKVIGKQGRTIRSLRNLVDAAASKLNKRVTLEIIEDDDYEDEEGGGNANDADENRGNRA
jgi:predicted RNA-binding protein YlqC (UPF0109 family)